jgi:hypothetical protein
LDAGWHIEGSFEVGGDWWVNYRSRARGLLALYLFSDVGAASAPTRVRPGSHPGRRARPGRTRDGTRGSWPSLAWPCTTRSPLVPPLSPVELAMWPERAA